MKRKIAIMLIIIMFFTIFAFQYQEAKANPLIGVIPLATIAAGTGLAAEVVVGIILLMCAAGITFVTVEEIIQFINSYKQDLVNKLTIGDDFVSLKEGAISYVQNLAESGKIWITNDSCIESGSHHFRVCGSWMKDKIKNMSDGSEMSFWVNVAVKSAVDINSNKFCYLLYWEPYMSGKKIPENFIPVLESGMHVFSVKRIGGETWAFYLDGRHVTNAYLYDIVPTIIGSPISADMTISVKTSKNVVRVSPIAVPEAVPLAFNPPKNATDERRLQDYVPFVKQTVISSPKDLVFAPPADVPSDRIEPPSLPDSITQTLSRKFPFSLPWDVAYVVAMFESEPEAPRLSFSVFGGKIDIDLSFLDSIMPIVRQVLFLITAVGIIFKTRNLLGGGQ